MNRHQSIDGRGVRARRGIRPAVRRMGGRCSAPLPSLLLAFSAGLGAAGDEPGAEPYIADPPEPVAMSRPRWIEPLTLDDGASRSIVAAATRSAPANDRWQDARLVLHHRRDAGDDLPLALGDLLALHGAKVERRSVELEIDVDQIRYFHAENAQAAAALASTLETVLGPIDVRDFTHYRPRPSAALLELWLH